MATFKCEAAREQSYSIAALTNMTSSTQDFIGQPEMLSVNLSKFQILAKPEICMLMESHLQVLTAAENSPRQGNRGGAAVEIPTRRRARVSNVLRLICWLTNL